MNNIREFEKLVLLACSGLVVEKHQAMAAVSHRLDIDAKWILLPWLLRVCPQYGSVPEWSFFFHGHDCDLERDDGTIIIAEFCSLGHDDSFSLWGLTRFISSSAPSQFVHPDLRNIIREVSPEGYVTVNQEPISIACDRLLELGHLEQRSGLRSIADIPEAIASRYSITEDSYLFSISKCKCLALTPNGIECLNLED